ncbi:MAG: hypothetical protein KDM81_13610, partial [Verrucomicrobiae bacterium]|nr:hypothetical protein [Verrucomicrobiae bacterium]
MADLRGGRFIRQADSMVRPLSGAGFAGVNGGSAPAAVKNGRMSLAEFDIERRGESLLTDGDMRPSPRPIT